jgi:hypothetical protein
MFPGGIVGADEMKGWEINGVAGMGVDAEKDRKGSLDVRALA